MTDGQERGKVLQDNQPGPSGKPMSTLPDPLEIKGSEPGLGHRPFKPVTRVRIPPGAPPPGGYHLGRIVVPRGGGGLEDPDRAGHGGGKPAPPRG